MKKFIFPLNFEYSNKFLGMFEYKTLVPLCILGFAIGYIISKCNLDIATSVSIFILIFLPLFLIFNTKIFKEPLYLFLICIIRHFVNMLLYK